MDSVMPRYWAKLQPYWETVSIYDGPEVFLSEFARLPKPIDTLFSGQWCESEVCNGGLHQFFTNPTGVLAPEAAAAFEAVGMPRLASVLREAMVFFGPEYPRDRETRENALWPGGVDALSAEGEEEDEFENPFEALDERFFELLRSEAGGWEAAANRLVDAGSNRDDG